ncbi:unnamed protein product [Ectocarpus sp. 12 AP-2014]
MSIQRSHPPTYNGQPRNTARATCQIHCACVAKRYMIMFNRARTEKQSCASNKKAPGRKDKQAHHAHQLNWSHPTHSERHTLHYRWWCKSAGIRCKLQTRTHVFGCGCPVEEVKSIRKHTKKCFEPERSNIITASNHQIPARVCAPAKAPDLSPLALSIPLNCERLRERE